MPDMEYLTRREHEEFAKRMDEANARRDDEDKRQNKRLDRVEQSIEKFNEMVAAIQQLTVQMKNMNDTLVNQGESIRTLEQKPAKRWESVVSDVIKLLVAALFGFIAARLGLG